MGIEAIGKTTTNEAELRRKNEQQNNGFANVAYAGIPDIGSLLNGSQNQQSTVSGHLG